MPSHGGGKGKSIFRAHGKVRDREVDGVIPERPLEQVRACKSPREEAKFARRFLLPRSEPRGRAGVGLRAGGRDARTFGATVNNT